MMSPGAIDHLLARVGLPEFQGLWGTALLEALCAEIIHARASAAVEIIEEREAERPDEHLGETIFIEIEPPEVWTGS